MGKQKFVQITKIATPIFKNLLWTLSVHIIFLEDQPATEDDVSLSCTRLMCGSILLKTLPDQGLLCY